MSDTRPQNAQEEDVRRYFERIARRFDSYYREEADTGGLVGKIAHIVFRKPAMACRFEKTFEFLGSLKGKSILDAGCGSGIYSIEIARRGGRATGVDVSQVMIDMAAKNAEEAGVSESCRFQVQDVMDFDPGGDAYAACLAIGFFDYIRPERQRAVLAKLLSLAKGDVIATFPRKWVPATFFRKAWFLKKRLDVYFFTRKRIDSLVDPEEVDVTYVNCRSVWTVRFAIRSTHTSDPSATPFP